MTFDESAPGALIALTAGGVGLVLDATGGRLPAVVHWGAALGAMTAEQAAALATAGVPVIGSNNVDVPPRPAVLPEHHTGWTGRPGLAGSRGGRQWSPAFAVTAILVDGVPATGYVGTGPACVEFRAVDEAAQLRLELVVALLPTGLVRLRAAVTNLADEPYTVDGLTLALPVPADADELLDFAGRHNQERVPQRRRSPPACTCARTAAGAPAPTAPTCCTRARRASASPRGEVWAVHTAWSGNHVHYAERVATGE